MTSAAAHADPFELLEQLRAAAEPLGLVVELRPAAAPEPEPDPPSSAPVEGSAGGVTVRSAGRWSSGSLPAAAVHNRAAIVTVLERNGWMAPREIAAVLGAPGESLKRHLRALLEAGEIEHNDRGPRARKYRRAAGTTSTPNDGDGEAEQAAATPVEGAGSHDGASAPMDRDPSPGDPAAGEPAAAAVTKAPSEERALDTDEVAAEASSTTSEPPLHRDLVPIENRGARTARERVLVEFDQVDNATVNEMAARLRSAGYAKGDVAGAMFGLHHEGDLRRSGQRNGGSVYWRVRP